MRRSDREITDYDKMLEIAKKCDCLRLGLLDDNEVYIVPLNFGLEDCNGKLVMYCHGALEGRKIELINRNGKASFEMDRKHELVEGHNACSYSYKYQSIMGTAAVEIVENSEEKAHGLSVLMSHYSDNFLGEFQKEMLDSVSVIKIIADKWSCKEH